MLPDGYGVRKDGQSHRIATQKIHNDQIDSQIALRAKARLEVLFRKYCDMGPTHIPDDQLRFEARYDRDGKSIGLYAFKAIDVRMYGFCTGCDNRPTFFVTGSDLSKKRQKARPALLKSAGSAALDLHAEINK